MYMTRKEHSVEVTQCSYRAVRDGQEVNLFNARNYDSTRRTDSRKRIENIIWPKGCIREGENLS